MGMGNPLTKYMHWLHTRWPAGVVEKLPVTGADGATNIPGVRVVGDLTGIPLLKFSADTGARAVQAILREPDFRRSDIPVATGRGKNAAPTNDVLDLAIIGAGVSGISAALEAKKVGLNFQVFEAVQPFSTIVNFPKGKPIYTFPTEMTPVGELQFRGKVKEDLLAELEAQRAGIAVTPVRIERIQRDGNGFVLGENLRAKRVIVAIGRSGNYRRLDVPGKTLDKVSNRLHDPKDFAGKNALVVGGGDSALEVAIALAEAGAHVVLSYRGKEFARPKPDNIEKLHRLPVQVRLLSKVQEIRADSVVIDGVPLPNDVVFVMIGREAPLDFFRRSGLAIRGEWQAKTWLGFLVFFLFCFFLYNWKASGAINQFFRQQGWFPFNFSTAPLSEPGFYYSLAYCLCVVLFGFDRMLRKPTPYVRWQTLTLMAIQVGSLFLLPYFILPAMGDAGWFAAGLGKLIGDNLFPYGEYWRAFGLILAWPLFIWNFFTPYPMTWWLVIGGVQTFVIIPLIIWRWGKGAYCGWICSCGALAETLGDRHRTKMPHGPVWNRLNMIGQVILVVVFVLFGLRAFTWAWPGTMLDGLFNFGLGAYYRFVDIFLAGVVGVGLYFWFSGRAWCRFACPLAALMHFYARFSKFRIFPEKSKCISCNVCTSVCHQGIDVMNFANKGLPMEDPQCVRCSACVQECPTGVLVFGRLEGASAILDKLPASPVRMREAAK